MLCAVSATLRRTPLYEEHRSLGARLVPFAGWEMPVQYAGVIDDAMKDEVQVTVIATGFGARPRRRRLEAPVPGTTRPEAPRPSASDEIDIPSFLKED